MPEIAFAPLICGVCKVGGTLVMISKPVNEARIRIHSPMMKNGRALEASASATARIRERFIVRSPRSRTGPCRARA